ncbi:MAG TPA: RsmG family class I SAM-dependent methyltransferase [Acidobacteriota bacterium]|nr:RsmG family class I SAM-dependent methyltransferase [Acidobacteriota bacterium]
MQRRFDVELDAGQIEAMERYWDLLAKWNRRLSLTAVKSYPELLEFHFFEGFLAADRLLRADEGCLADIGAGAGLPGLAFALLRPALDVRLLESNQRKGVFLNQAVRACRLNSRVFSGRAEDYTAWDEVDAASVRALKTSSALEGMLAERGIPLLALHGRQVPVSGRVDYETEERVRVPGSRNRWVSRLVFR